MARPFRGWQGTPLTDPVSLAGTVFLHALLLGLGWFFVLGVAPTVPPLMARVVRGEIESIPVDTRAPQEPPGGAPGPLGGSSSTSASTPIAARVGAGVDQGIADTLLADSASSAASSEALQAQLPPPSTSSVGVMPGTDPGGGGGLGGGSGGGIGTGRGPSTEFFGTKESGRSFAYVIDCSGSMAVHRSLDVAKAELLHSLGPLPQEAKFGIVFYNLQTTVFPDPKGQSALMNASAVNKERAKVLMPRVTPDGGTDHMRALRAGLALRPEVLFFLTDADLMTQRDVDEILAEVGTTRIQAIEFGVGPDLNASGPLRRLAGTSGGTYRYVDVANFGRAGR